MENMSKSNQQELAKSRHAEPFLKFLAPVAEIWVLFTIVAFFVVRVFGSNIFKHLFRGVGH